MANYIKNKYKRDKRVSSKKQNKEVKKLYNQLMQNPEQMDTVYQLAETFINNNIDNPNLALAEPTFFLGLVENIDKAVVEESLYPLPLSKAIKQSIAKRVERYYQEELKKIISENKRP